MQSVKLSNALSVKLSNALFSYIQGRGHCGGDSEWL